MKTFRTVEANTQQLLNISERWSL